MQSSRWLSFGYCNTVADTLLHLFPSSTTASAPYPITTRFRMFHSGEQSRTVTVEGMRLGQPDGVRLSDLFSSLREGSVGPVGVEVSFHTLQPRLNLSGSRCVVEIASRAISSRFFAAPVLSFSSGVVREKPRLVVKDSLAKTSLVLLNGSNETVEAVVRQSALEGAAESQSPCVVEQLGPFSAVEVSLPESLFERANPVECSWGLLRGASVHVEMNRVRSGEQKTKLSRRDDGDSALCSSFLVFRDPTTHVPLSVQQPKYSEVITVAEHSADQAGSEQNKTVTAVGTQDARDAREVAP